MADKSDLPNNTFGSNQQSKPAEYPVKYGDIYNLSGDFPGAIINIKSNIGIDAQWEINRRYMLNRVRKDWIEGVLESAIAIQSLIELGIQQEVSAIRSPWDNIIERKTNSSVTFDTTTQIVDVFDASNGSLLILGEPGAGKTITLLQLANKLLQRAETRSEDPIPVVLTLSSWDEKCMPLEDWLVDELRSKYFVPRAVAENWISKNNLTLLLDGLDEVHQEKRPICIEAINSFREDHGPAQIVICSRKAEYDNQSQRLHLDEAILLQPFDEKQLNQILMKTGEGRIVLEMLQRDTTLRQLAKTPLMLSIMFIASREISTLDWGHVGSIEAHRERLFKVYVKNVFSRRGPSEAYLKEPIVNVLHWLASKMSDHGETMFLLENLGPRWLKAKWQLWTFHLGLRLLAVTLLALVVSLIYFFGLVSLQTGSKTALAVEIATKMTLAVSSAALFTSFLSMRLNNTITLFTNIVLTSVTCGLVFGDYTGGLLAGFVLGIPGGATVIAIRDPRMTDRLYWSWKRVLLVLFAILGIEIVAGMLIYYIWGIDKLSAISEILLLGALPIGTGITLAFGWRPSLRVTPTVKPNQGFWQSLRNAIGTTIFLVLVLLPLSLPSGISQNIVDHNNLWESSGISASLFFMMSIVGLAALPLSLLVGGGACLQQLLVRLILITAEKLPWDLVQILDKATDRIILQRVGGGYIFQHRLLQDYFAYLKSNQFERSKNDHSSA